MGKINLKSALADKIILCARKTNKNKTAFIFKTKLFLMLSLTEKNILPIIQKSIAKSNALMPMATFSTVAPSKKNSPNNEFFSKKFQKYCLPYLSFQLSI